MAALEPFASKDDDAEDESSTSLSPSSLSSSPESDGVDDDGDDAAADQTESDIAIINNPTSSSSSSSSVNVPVWLSRVALAVAHRVLDQLDAAFGAPSSTSVSITAFGVAGRRQASADLTYLANVLSALDVQPMPLPRLVQAQDRLVAPVKA